jgi:uncharacterized protein YjiS (DUF1127 family)
MSRISISEPFSQLSAMRMPITGMARAATLLGRAMQRRRQRRELADLTPQQMRDVGLDPVSVRLESRKPFWIA